MRGLKEFVQFIAHILRSRELLVTLIKNDFRKQYLGSYLGLFWAFFQPLIFMSVIWFVFEKGFRPASPVSSAPFFLWLICGMIPWLFISNVIVNGTSAVFKNSFLVKKVSFRISILPIVEIGSALIIHAVLLVFLLAMLLVYGYQPSWYWLQLFYYLGCSVLLLLGLTWLTSALRVFIKDVGNIVAVLTQIGFWATPIFWSVNILPDNLREVFDLNPVAYIVSGYRDSFINEIWFWQRPELMLYNLFIIGAILLVGALVFKRLRPHFGDVL